MRQLIQRLRGTRENARPTDAATMHGAVLLASGISLRGGLQADALAAQEGEPLLREIARRALATQPAALIVSVPADDHTALEVVLRGLPLRCLPVRRGMAQGAALRAALAVLPHACAGVLLVPCDRAAADAGSLTRMLDAWRAQPERAVSLLNDARVPGLPALLPRAWWHGLDPGNGLALRNLLQTRAAEVEWLEAGTAAACGAESLPDVQAVNGSSGCVST
jgi:CTP:molybdopterin cytidylyltransferase MocA